jgi:nitrile hydratase
VTYASQADLGGTEGHGAVLPEAEGEPFHADWERHVFGMTLAMGATGAWNLDMSRAARETLPIYRRSSYYQLWFEGLKKLLVARRLVSAQELADGAPIVPARAAVRVLRADAVAAGLAKGAPTIRPASATAKFKVGDRVRTRSAGVSHHTRLPRYAAGKQGLVERVLGAHVFPDSHARGRGEDPKWLYTVVFEEQELWGVARRRQGLKVSIDAWEPYLEPA